MSERYPAEGFHPSEYLVEEMEARGWTVGDLAERSGLTVAGLTEVIERRVHVTTPIAKALAQAFGTSHEMWLNLNNQYEAWLMHEAANLRSKSTPESK